MACCFQSNHRTSRWMRASRTLLEVFELERKPWGPNISERCFQVSIWRYLVPVLVAGSCRRFWFYGCTPTNQMSKRRNRRVEMRQELRMHFGCESFESKRIRCIIAEFGKHSSLWLVIVVLRRIRSSFIREKRIIQFEMIIWNNFRQIQMQTSALVNTPLWSSWIRK